MVAWTDRNPPRRRRSAAFRSNPPQQAPVVPIMPHLLQRKSKREEPLRQLQSPGRPRIRPSLRSAATRRHGCRAYRSVDTRRTGARVRNAAAIEEQIERNALLTEASGACEPCRQIATARFNAGAYDNHEIVAQPQYGRSSGPGGRRPPTESAARSRSASCAEGVNSTSALPMHLNLVQGGVVEPAYQPAAIRLNAAAINSSGRAALPRIWLCATRWRQGGKRPEDR